MEKQDNHKPKTYSRLTKTKTKKERENTNIKQKNIIEPPNEGLLGRQGCSCGLMWEQEHWCQDILFLADQSCLTLCNPMDCSLPDSFVMGFS